MYSTRVSTRIDAPAATIYRALLDPDAVAKWRVPDGMTATVHTFDAREGGSFRVSLTYEAPTGSGKSTSHTDTYHGRFVELVPEKQVVEVMKFETDDPRFRGEMRMTTTLREADGATDVEIVHDGIPDAVPAGDNDLGTRIALDNLARLVEGQRA